MSSSSCETSPALKARWLSPDGSVMDVAGERGRVFDDDVGVPKAPAAPLSPVLMRRVAKCGGSHPMLSIARGDPGPTARCGGVLPHHAGDAKRLTTLPLWKVAPRL